MFDAKVIRVLIASPGDVADEREAVRRTIWNWNSVHGERDGVMLLPVMWEHDVTPSIGRGGGAQGVINDQLVDPCEMLIGVFWTRLGTPTDAAESGTVEEINRAINAGRPALIYFSDKGIPPSAIDQEQLTRLRDFKQSLSQKGLYADYQSVAKLELRLADDITRTVRAMGVSVPEQSVPTPTVAQPEPSAQTPEAWDRDISLVLDAVMSFQPDDGGITIPDAKDVHEKSGLSLDDFNFAVGEIKARGLAETVETLGMKPYVVRSLYPSHSTRRWLRQNPSPAAATPSSGGAPAPAVERTQPDFGIDANNLTDANGRYFDFHFIGGNVEARNVLAMVRTDGQAELLNIQPDWIEKRQRDKRLPHARTGAFPLSYKPVLEMTYENLIGDRFYLAADLLVDGRKVHVAHRTVTTKRPKWSWLDRYKHIPLQGRD